MSDRPYVSCVAPLATPRRPSASPAEPKQIRADQLTVEQKRAVWAHILQHEPQLHTFLTDPVMVAFRERQGAVPLFDVAMVERAMEGRGHA